MALDSSGARLACHGMRWDFTDVIQNPTSKVGYLFILNASDGSIVSGVLRMTHIRVQLVQSKGFVLRDSGELYLTIG